MTRNTNARLAGVAYLLYIAVSLPAVILFSNATSGQGIAAKLAGIAQNALNLRLTLLLSMPSGFAALILAVTLYRITRDEDRDIAMIAMMCRVAEAVTGVPFFLATLGLLSIATTTGLNAADTAAAHTLATFFLQVREWNPLISALFFATGSMLFCWLLARGRIVPIPLAWFGVIASVLLVVLLPIQLIGFFEGPIFQLMWLPMGVFEIVLAIWFLSKGVRGRSEFAAA
ncbi:MAG TPA: DUF4386 domain-containing protein [Gemmatimonadaceae bacterium]|nr:DUF4386 domain-containing protein [Gemmatimonadaceae bacterium]